MNKKTVVMLFCVIFCMVILSTCRDCGVYLWGIIDVSGLERGSGVGKSAGEYFYRGV